MSELGILAYCTAMGFVSAATISSFYQWVTAEQADFSMARASIPGMLVVVVVSMFAGPFIVVRKVVSGLRSREMRALPALLGVLVAGTWSVCAGIFYVGLLVSV